MLKVFCMDRVSFHKYMDCINYQHKPDWRAWLAWLAWLGICSMYMNMCIKVKKHWRRQGARCILSSTLHVPVYHHYTPNEEFADIMVLASPPPRPPVDPDDMNTLTRNIFNLSLSNCMRVDTPLRYFAIEIWYPPMTRTTAFAAKRPPNLQNAISP